MTPEQLYVYTEETSIHTQLALSNYRAFIDIISNSDTRQRREAWMYLQSFLSHFGMVSKLLFAPSGNRRTKNRARELSEYLESSDNATLNDRNARNAIEHLDERMDYWLDNEHKGILEGIYETENDFSYFAPERWTVRRVYILAESLFITEDANGHKKMKIEPIVNELVMLNTRCDIKLNNHLPFLII